MRNSPTDKNGRIHTSLITVAVLRIPEKQEVEIKDSDLDFRFLRASSKGGQHANKTESGVVIKHIPTGLEVKSHSDRSQHVNKELALEILRSKLL
jgi:peptide chain release factor 1